MSTADSDHASALEQIREQVRAAARTRTAIRLRGAGTKDFYGERFEGNIVDLRGYHGIVDYEPSELVMSARCGTSLRDIERTLAQNNQFLAFEPPTFGADPTLGGVIAAGLSGPRRLQVGAARDFVLGATLLDANAQTLHFGGRVMKNVAGFDLSRLLCGSLGILGIITQISLKVLPRPHSETTLRLDLSARDALALFNRWGGLPLPISAAAWFDDCAWVRLSGAAAAVKAARERLGGDPVEARHAEQLWNCLRDCHGPIFQQPRLWRVSVPSTAAPLPLPGPVLIDWGGALRWHGGDLPAAQVRCLAAAVGGTAQLWRGEGNCSRFHPLPPASAQLHRRLKQRFDPQGLFNPGRLVPDL